MSDAARRHIEPVKNGREEWVRSVRLGSGLILLLFVTAHLINHGLALISIETAEAGLPVLMAPWRNPVGGAILLSALVSHVGLAFLALYKRRSLVMPPKEAAQFLLGLAAPILIAEHVVGTQTYSALSGVRADYASVVYSLWVQTPLTGAKQAIALLAIWGHGSIGLYFWLRYRSWFAPVAPFLLVFATLLPVLALLGFVNAGRAVVSAPLAANTAVSPETLNIIMATKDRALGAFYAVYGLVIGLLLVVRGARTLRERNNLIEIRYPDRRTIRVPKGFSVLEASRLAGIPHHAVCGSRGRCSTCRVKVLEGMPRLPPPDSLEQATLSRIHANPDVRLACQLRPLESLSVIPLLSTSVEGAGRIVTAQASPGREQDVAVLFCDIRGFTALADRRLPFDTVFLLNRYFAVVGKAVENSGGRLDKFVGDGAMAIFGLEVSLMEACRQAVTAAIAIVNDLAHVSQELAAELHAPLRVAIGIHAGAAIAGSMGYGRVLGVTVIGDTVNVASRLESIAKELDVNIVISSSAATLSGIDFAEFEERAVEIRGRSKPLKVITVPQNSRISLDASATASVT